MYNVSAILVGNTSELVTTDRIGYFQFINVPDGFYTLKIINVGFDPIEKEVAVSNNKVIEVGDILLTYNPKNIDVGLVTLNDDELASEESSMSSNASILQSSRDVFSRVSAFELGSYWFKPRGYDNKYFDIHFNGIRMNKIDNGRVNFNNWGGLNDVTRRPDELKYGLESSDYTFGDIGGVTNFDTRPSTMRKGLSLSYSLSNRSYNNRIMASYNTGLLDNGWAIMVSGTRRWANEGLIEGTFHDSWSYFLGIEKKINNRHTFNFTTFGAPNRRASGSPNTQELVDLKGIYYNSYWGWQDGEKRSERVKKTYEPVFQFTHHWNIGKQSKLLSTVSYQFGKDSSSRLDWFNAQNPTPNYYKNMPSYWQYLQDDVEYEKYLENWTNGKYSQIDWSKLYQANQNIKIEDNGLRQSVYYVADDVNSDKIATFYTNFKTSLSKSVQLIVAANYQNVKSNLYREVVDLLGGDYVRNFDDFNNVSFDVNNIGYSAKKGDVFDYDYTINKNLFDVFVQTKYRSSFFDITLGIKAAYVDFLRDGKFKHGLYLNNSHGKSSKYDFFNIGLKGNLLLKLDGKNFLMLNGQYMTEAPNAEEIFPNARLHHVTIKESLNNAEIKSGDISFIHRSPKIKTKATVFYTLVQNDIEKGFGYIDGAEGSYFVSEVLSGVNKQYFGGEFAVEAQLTSDFKLSAVAALGQHTYINNPNYYLFSDDFMIDSGEAYKNYGTSYLKDYKLQTGPQSAYSLGIEYRNPKFWWIGVSGNLLANNYIDVAPYRRTTNFIRNIQSVVDDQLLKNVLKQHRLSDEFMLNLNIGKTFRFGKYFLGTSLTINNILNNKEYVTSGFEQLRLGNYDNAINNSQQKLFGPRMFYGSGTTYFLNVYLRI